MMRMHKSPMVAFLLSFLPGAGHAYLGRPVRFLLYGGSFFGSIGLFLFLLPQYSIGGEAAVVLFFIAAISGIVNMLDMIVTLVTGNAPGLAKGTSQRNDSASYNQQHGGDNTGFNGNGYSQGDYQQGTVYGQGRSYEHQQVKTKTMLLSIIPGLGHMSIGLMQRGITFLISFVGLFAIIVFLSAVMGSGAILVFLLILPIIWVYGMYDAVSLVDAKHRGEVVEDRSLFEGIEAHIATGHKNKVLAISLAIFPGAGHLYMGLQKRGLQLMTGFLLAIYIMDNLRLSLFLFLLPLFWCFAFFDALGQISRYERQKLSDEPILPLFVPYQRWFGLGLLVFGIYFIVDRIMLKIIFRYFPDIQSHYIAFKYMLPTAVIAFVMIALGLRLAFGGKSILGGGSIDKSGTTSSERRGSERS
ncbi:hypothetical protein [Paenibacillus sp. L3-i20]|uniref:hypothetical protein n=1 Tax=Paenibacillus sp. L3-i20 TaxID=2905833 RepID=UPI001EDCB2FC|nr:hypothetical protein [Paenibacillus sp. L3-i20]GKU77690.1 hypothetical protein L3i20_v220870 [Paenibacillus sp. L3-i20]